MSKKEEHGNESTGKEVKVAEPAATRAYPSPWDEMERWMEQVFPAGWLEHEPWTLMRRPWPSLFRTALSGARVPKVDVIDRPDEVVVKAELPGVTKDNVEVTLSEDVFTLQASSQAESKEEKGQYFYREMSRGEFSRSLRLPCAVDADKAKATFKDGILEVVIPKAAGSKRQTIKID
ncbi:MULTISPECIES: Hsp20/alpha crystallin family protein [Methylococcus]|uniref:Hsp20/alpha crystallin family protein n=1 Tax=Methylococcus capsulatus TaxID=414 RepID=A0ABZ2F289_METCP|nr:MULTISPECIES: Hsp20/alpha crystallin family protein [Methylococcus]MDF9392195.1 Hsp20/alpha crystallin family protein [Methylococcus capsulatus]